MSIPKSIDPYKHYTQQELLKHKIYGVIYEITNSITPQKYIGKSNNYHQRINQRKQEVESQNIVGKGGVIYAMRIFGIQNFSYRILDVVKLDRKHPNINDKYYDDKLNKLEILWIKKLGTKYNGYNQTAGGETHYGDFTEVIQYSVDGKLIKEWKSIKEANAELKVSGNSVSGIPRACLGIAQIAFGYQWRYKESTKVRRRIAPIRGKYEIAQYDKNGTFIRKFKSPIEAAIIIGKKKNQSGKIASSAKDQKPIVAYGYQWRYIQGKDFPTVISPAINSNKLVQHYKDKSKPVAQYSLSGKFIAEFRTTDEAMIKTGVNRATIKMVASGKYQHAGGYVWRYKSDGKFEKKIAPYKRKSEKEILQIDLKTGKIIKKWKSAREANRIQPKFNFRGISAVVNGTQKTYKGYYWSLKKG